MSVILAEQIKPGDTIAMEDDGELFDMSLELEDQEVSWEAVTVQRVQLYPATSIMDIFLPGGYRCRMSMGQEIYLV